MGCLRPKAILHSKVKSLLMKEFSDISQYEKNTMTSKIVPFVLCDVFAERQFEGNQLAVITDASMLTSDEMQKIASEFNFSESTFVLEAKKAYTHRIRIFTPTHEVPFAGHPNVGTAHVLASDRNTLEFPINFKFQEDAGAVDVTVSESMNGIFCEIRAPEPLSIGASVKPNEIAEALGLTHEDINTKLHAPLIGSVGLPFILAGVSSREVLASAEVNLPGFKNISERYPCRDILVYWIDSNAVIHSRVFAPFDNVPEDPATGSANGALVALLSSINADQNYETKYTVHQGDDMGRPCRLYLRVKKHATGDNEIFIGGCSMITGTGNLILETKS